MRKRKTTILIAIMAAALLVLSACGGGGGGITDSNDFNEPEAATEAVEDLESSVANGDSAKLAARISDTGVSANILGENKTYSQSESQELINELDSAVTTQNFNIVNRNTTVEENQDESNKMVITGEIVEANSPFNDSYTATSTAASDQIELQYDADNFTIETPDNWFEDSISIDDFNMEAFSAYSKIKDEGFAVIYIGSTEIDSSDFYLEADQVAKEIENHETELNELGIYNMEITNTSQTKVNGYQALRIDDTFDTEYKLYELVLEFRMINGKYYLFNIRVEPKEKAESLMSRKETAYLVNADNKLVILDYSAETSAYSQNNLENIVNSFKLK